jgi:hypothetical protein
MDLSFSSQDKSCHEHSDIGWNGGTFPEDLKVHLRCGIAAAPTAERFAVLCVQSG